MKTDIQNILSYVLKRKENLSDSKQFRFFMSMYAAKRNKYGQVPQDRQQGQWKRKLIVPEDMEKIDNWACKPHHEENQPKHLAYKVGLALLEHDCSRGTGVLYQIRRSFFHPMYENGQLSYRVKNNVVRKTMRGNGKGIYKPMDFLVSAKHEVEIIRRLLKVLPNQGCCHCLCADIPKQIGEDPECSCDMIFLNEVDQKRWRVTDQVWFKRQKMSREALEGLVREICKLAENKEDHTNGDIRCTVMTSLAMAKLSPDQVNMFSKSTPAQQEHYKRLGEQMTEKQIRQATALTSASGRNALQGKENLFGELGGGECEETMMIYKRYMVLFNSKVS